MAIRVQNMGRGIDWITEGFALFRLNPLIWIVLTLIYLGVLTVVSLIPFVGTTALTLIQPALTAGFMAGCRDLAAGGELRIEHLFEGFRRNTQPLLMVGLLSLAAYIVIGIVSVGVFLVFGGAAVELGLLSGNVADSGAVPVMASGGILMAGLVFLALAVPVAMATWFAPALVWFDGLPALDAMQQSFVGCWRNVLPFLLYGLLGGLLLIVAAIPLGLGLLVLMPVLVASVYSAYLDIYSGATS